MLSFFPRPYPDELFYGICARYHQRSGHTSVGDTLRDLFGNRRASVSLDFPTNIRSVIESLPPLTTNTLEHLLFNHTMLPLFLPFLPKKRTAEILKHMIGETTGGNIHMTIGVTASAIPPIAFLRYCTSCLDGDVVKYGEPYWHRSHQVAGLMICHLHHERLRDSTIAAHGIGGRHNLVPLSLGIPSVQGETLDIHCPDHHSWIAETVHWLLNDNPLSASQCLERIRHRYLIQLHRLGLASASGRLYGRKLLERFLAYYGNKFLSECHCPLSEDYSENWLLSLLRKPWKAVHPLRHLLVVRFIGLELREFFLGGTGSKPPFGRGPWRCLNPAASHYLQAVVSDCSISRRPSTGPPVGRFSCSCGFVYERTGPDQCREDKFKISRMVSYGVIWGKCLLRLIVDEGKGLRETARRLGVDPKTVKRHLRNLLIPPHGTSPESPEEQILHDRRKSWLRACASSPMSGAKEIRLIAGGDYAWLYRHDREWLRSHSPHKPRPSPTSRIDWDRRDTVLASLVSAAAREAYNNPGRPVRVTVGAIGKRLGATPSFEKLLPHLPRTQTALAEVVESKDMFAIRRLRWAAEKLKEQGEPVRAWKLKRLAGLRPETLIRASEEIGRLVA